MSAYHWKEEFCTGIEVMDNHHKVFFRYLLQLEAAAGGSNGRGAIDRGIELLDDYIRYHFAEEEKILKWAGYPGFVEHKRQHDFFISQLKDLKERHSEGDPSIPVSALQFLRDWFLLHILESDKSYGVYLSGRRAMRNAATG